MIRIYKYRLHPNEQQTHLLDQLFWQARTLYNAALEQRINVYQETGKGVNYPAQWSHFRDQRHNKPDVFGMLNATSVQQMLRRLDKSFSAFFRRLKAGESPGFPRFKSRSRFKSVKYRYGDGCKLRRQENGQVRFYLQNIGEVKVIYHRPVPKTAILKHVVVKRVNDKWYLCLMLEIPAPEHKPIPAGSAIGIDMGLQSLLAYKVAETGCQLVVVDPAYTSQLCSRCGGIVEKGLSVRVHKCNDCGLELDRDVNAAWNVLQKAFHSLGLSDQDLTWAVASSVS